MISSSLSLGPIYASQKDSLISAFGLGQRCARSRERSACYAASGPRPSTTRRRIRYACIVTRRVPVGRAFSLSPWSSPRVLYLSIYLSIIIYRASTARVALTNAATICDALPQAAHLSPWSRCRYRPHSLAHPATDDSETDECARK